MTAPLVSILLPTYNRAKHLPGRIASIENQTLGDYEVIVCDSGSTDGSVELLDAWMKRDSRVSVHQVPKEGIYPGWNECIKRARGKYVYWATSDDSMEPNALELLHNALGSHSECRVAMCGLAVVDERGNLIQGEAQWRNSPWGRFWGARGSLDREHVRNAPLDLVLAGVLHNPWHSSNQLLIERSLYEELGLYRTDLGSGADFEWNIRAASTANVAFIPLVLATLLSHEESATVLAETRNTADMDIKVRILDGVLSFVQGRDAGLAGRLERAGWREPFRIQAEIYRWREQGRLKGLIGFSGFVLKGGFQRWAYLASFLLNARKGKEGLRAAIAMRVLRRFGISERKLP